MKNFLFVSLSLFFGCKSVYKDLKPAEENCFCAEKWIPDFQKEWYRTRVDVMGKHISGLLLIKKMDVKTFRFLFTNEAGLKFFDFEISNNRFVIHHIIRQLDKKAVISTLKGDLELVILNFVERGNCTNFTFKDLVYFGFPQKKEINYLVVSRDCSSLMWIEKGSKRKSKVRVDRFPGFPLVPDSLSISHQLFEMNIRMKRIQP